MDLDSIRAELDDIQSHSKGQFPRIRPKPGQNIYRIMPEYDGKRFYVKAFFHWKIAGMTFPCNATWGQECYTCGVSKIMKDRGKDKLANHLTSRPTYYLNALDLSSVIEVSKGVQVLTLSRPPMGQILGFISNPRFADLLNPQTGRAIFIDMRGSGIETTYTVYPDAAPAAIPDMNFLNKLFKLHELMTPVDIDKMKSAIEKLFSAGEAVNDPRTFTPAAAPAPAAYAPPALPYALPTGGTAAPYVLPQTATATPPPVMPSVTATPIPPQPAAPVATSVTPAIKSQLDDFLAKFEKR